MAKPTIEELERILAGGDGPQRITVLPNGEIRAVPDWQPMEDAPKDGTWILLRGRNMAGNKMVPAVVAWAPPGGDLSGQGWRDSVSFYNCDSLAAAPGADWQPLPPT